MSNLNSNQKRSLRNTSQQAISQRFTLLQHHLKQSRWLPKRNSYRYNCIQSLKRHSQLGQSINQLHLAQYIAASAPLHCADGWSFLGRAVDCHIRGDVYSAKHLGYYAELRATMALLAAVGVGIFDSKHFIINGTANCQRIPGGLRTHQITWLALEHWANLRRSGELLREIITPGGIPLGEWLDGFGVGANIRAIGGSWLKTWGLDLRRFSEDRETRNEASYRPTQLNASAGLNAKDANDVLEQFWRLCEPSPSSRFDTLDRHLLRLSIEKAFKATTGNNPGPGVQSFLDKVDRMLDSLSNKISAVDEWKQFLTRSKDKETPLLLVQAGKISPINNPEHHVQVLSRAVLLLRIATGASSRLLRDGGIMKQDLAFWWRVMGIDRGLWEPNNEPADMTDLWADIERALQSLATWNQQGNAASRSYARRQKDCPSEIALLGSFERIALWGMGL